ncbi:FAD-linked oxidase C-terminal domain-containing protein [Methylobacterium sp. ARG-1]|uniref:FAD-linked oxidase C-terminal domain-containing protein n=1 Tax=Methylobacterium sp. ARG-1 TaxID=1692501 RepID=UPI0006808FBC|nr:FAD-linked oxidase C-terminal domain-containing protein [Methylobacterium sp. ARG-1]KNY19105.1 glycolate oxidase subunit GlcD [Methylobacterium sp. ARG-1]
MSIPFPQPDETILSRRHEILAALAALVPANTLLASEEARRAFETDALAAYRKMPLAVVLPSSTEEVSAILRFCHENSVKVVPRGAGTSLAGGAIPQEDAIVLGVSKLSRVLDVDFQNRTARVQAGVTNLTISQAVAHEGFFYAPDPSSQLACTIAGNIGMNSGGPHCLKYGVTTNHLLGVTAVLLDGTVVEIGGQHLDSPGYDLLALICGSEGQLAVVTEATVRILRAAENARPALIGFDSVDAAGSCVAAIIAAGIIPVAMEYMDRDAIRICEDFAHAGYPLDAQALLIVEVEGSEDEIQAALNRIAAIASRFGATTLRVAETDAEAVAIWKGRKSIGGATGRIADYIVMDGTIPTGQLPFVLDRMGEITRKAGLKVVTVLHAGDGNMHPMLMFDIGKPGELEKAEAVGEEILRLCVDVGGCITGEHGVGIEKRELMKIQFSDADLQQQMRVRAVFDPLWLMNPAKVYPLEGRLIFSHQVRVPSRA